MDASMALPPCFKTFTPTWVARWCALTTMPWSAITGHCEAAQETLISDEKTINDLIMLCRKNDSWLLLSKIDLSSKCIFSINTSLNIEKFTNDPCWLVFTLIWVCVFKTRKVLCENCHTMNTQENNSTNSGLFHMGGLKPSLPAVTRNAFQWSASLLATIMTCAPGTNSVRLPGRIDTMGTPWGITTDFSPPLYCNRIS